MPLTLRVDAAPWTAHLRSVAATRPGLVPVCKGNGYGFGVPRLAGIAVGGLGAQLIAVGTEPELGSVGGGPDCDVLVLTPDPTGPHEVPGGPPRERVIRTASTVGDAERLLAGGHRFVVECRTGVARHGVVPADFDHLRTLLLRPGGAPGFEGWGLHLPLAGAGTWGRWVGDRVGALAAAGLPLPTVFVSHLDGGELAGLQAALPGTPVRPRVGTELWLGRRDLLHPVATVLDVHPLRTGSPAGYWQGHARGPGSIVVVSGGTANGIGLQAPPPPSLRRRAGALRSAVGDSLGRARSPFLLDGRPLRFHEPPHQQVSLLWLPARPHDRLRGRREEPPERGSEVALRVRYTTTVFDAVDLVGSAGAP